MFAKVILKNRSPENNSAFTYKIPSEIINELKIGQSVIVPFGQYKQKGIIIELTEEPPPFKTRNIVKIEQNLLKKEQINLAIFISQYYKCSLQQSLKLFLPPKYFSKKIQLNYEQIISLNIEENEAINKISQNKYGKKQAEVIKDLIKDKIIIIGQHIEQKKYSNIVIKNLFNKGEISITQGKLNNPHERKTPDKEEKKELNLSKDQIECLEQIKKSTNNKFLIHGVTGSGKTEIFLQLALENSRENKQTLILTPEISLTPQLTNYFHYHFPSEIAVIHSRLSDTERNQNWHRIKNNQAKIIIGSRSAIFMPFSNLELIIMDEEHEWTYKQESAPRYNTKKVAEKIVGENKKLILASATPSLETSHMAMKKKYKLLTMNQRINIKDQSAKKEMPDTYVVDLREELKKGNYSIFSEKLESELHNCLKNKEQALLFVNRRGSASSISCRDCGQSITCNDCQLPMTYHRMDVHQIRPHLQCHHCGIKKNAYSICPNCNSPRIRQLGTGTQKVEEHLSKLFPKARILRVDKDTSSKKHSHYEIQNKIKNHEVDFIIGTQIISKGLDLPKINLVGIILADLSLNFPDFRSSERTFQLIMQVAGRAGRRDKAGTVIIQSYNPDHYSIQAAKNHDYESFYLAEMSIRKNLNYPPFTQIIKISFSDKDQKKCADAAQEAEKILEEKALEQNLKIKISIAPSLLFQIQGKYHYNLIAKCCNPSKLLHELKIPENWKIDIDPINSSI